MFAQSRTHSVVKKFLALTMILTIGMSSVYSPKAKADLGVSAIVAIVVGGISAVWTIYELITVGDEWSASTAEISGRVYNKRQFYSEIQEGALAYLAGEPASLLLQETLLESQNRLMRNLGNQAAHISQEDLVWITLDFVSEELSRL
jgi:hypothetical protein